MTATTREKMPVSIIVPVFNEASSIVRLQKQLIEVSDASEIIFVDGGSTDATRDLIDERFQVISSEKGRSRQMNAGAQASSGSILFFLHCDSIVPDDFLSEIKSVMQDNRFGCFGITFDERTPLMLVCRALSNFRCRFRKIIFGDQGLFIDRELFFELGMFPDIPLMEDYQLSLTLRQRGLKPGMTQSRIQTSARRYQGSTVHKLRTMYHMAKLRRDYRGGVPVEKIAAAYLDLR